MTTTPAFPVDLEALIADLRTLTELESPSTDPIAISRVMDVVEGWAKALGAETHGLPGGTRVMNLGVQEGQKYVLVLAHADTVWPHGTLAQMPFERRGNKLHGPGTYDMKAGIVGLFYALRAMKDQQAIKDHQEGWPAGGIKVLLSPDEEVGSGSSRAHIEQAAQGARAVLVIEPPVADSHNLKTGRKGTGSFVLTLTGIASHAGNRPTDGASAITAAAEAVLALQALARPELGTTVSAGLISGGTAVNVIPGECRLELDLRVSTLAEGERVTQAIQAWKPSDARVQVSLSGGLNRPPFEEGEATLKLYAQAAQIARELGFLVGKEVVGGGSDGNFTAPIAPTLDGLGAPGDGAHAAHEHVRLDRWPQHVQLLYRLLREV